MSSTAPPATQAKFFTSTDIAARFGVKLAAVSNWRRRYGPDSTNPFPTPEEGHPTPVWRNERWPEITAWDDRRGGQRPGRRSGTTRTPDNQYLTLSTIATRLNVTPSTVRQWRRGTWPVPFPEPDKEIKQTSRTIPLWLAARWPAIQWWRHGHLGYLAKRRQQPTRHQAGAGRHEAVPVHDTGPNPAGAVTLPSPAQFLKASRNATRTGARRGHVVRPSVRRLVL